MDYLVYDQELVIEHHPNKGAWTFRVVVPNTRAIRGTWHQLKVEGTIDDCPVSSNLKSLKDRDKALCVNATIRRQLGKQAGDTVRVTLYRVLPTPALTRADILSCFEDAGVLSRFSAQDAGQQEVLLRSILTQPGEARQENKLLACITALADHS